MTSELKTSELKVIVHTDDMALSPQGPLNALRLSNELAKQAPVHSAGELLLALEAYQTVAIDNLLLSKEDRMLRVAYGLEVLKSAGCDVECLPSTKEVE